MPIYDPRGDLEKAAQAVIESESLLQAARADADTKRELSEGHHEDPELTLAWKVLADMAAAKVREAADLYEKAKSDLVAVHAEIGE